MIDVGILLSLAAAAVLILFLVFMVGILMFINTLLKIIFFIPKMIFKFIGGLIR